MKRVKTDWFTDPDLTSLVERLEAVTEAWINSGHTIISVNIFENGRPLSIRLPYSAVVLHSYYKEPL